VSDLPVGDRSSPRDYLQAEVVFEALAFWKGDIDPRPVVTKTGVSSCAFHFELEKTYLVFAKPRDHGGGLSTSVCADNREVPSSKELAELGKRLGKPVWERALAPR
jgi:hypothetical protein